MSLSSSITVVVIVVRRRKASPTIALMSPLPPKIKGSLPALAICFIGDSWTKQATIRVSDASKRCMWSRHFPRVAACQLYLDGNNDYPLTISGEHLARLFRLWAWWIIGAYITHNSPVIVWLARVTDMWNFCKVIKPPRTRVPTFYKHKKTLQINVR